MFTSEHGLRSRNECWSERSKGTPASGFSQPTRRLEVDSSRLFLIAVSYFHVRVSPFNCWWPWGCHRRCCYRFFCRGPLPCVHLVFLLGIYLGTELTGHRVLECSGWVDTDNHFLKSFWFPLPPAESGNSLFHISANSWCGQINFLWVPFFWVC